MRIASGILGVLLGVVAVLWIVYLPIQTASEPVCSDVFLSGESLSDQGECIAGYEKDRTQFVIGSGVAGFFGLVTAGLALAFAVTGRRWKLALIGLALTAVAVAVTIAFLNLEIYTPGLKGGGLPR